MEIHKKLWHWCRRPIKPASTSFSRFVTPLSISILVACLIVGAILTAFMSITLFSPIMFSKSSRVESGWVPIELERIGFTGGTIVVRKIQYNPFEKGYISVTVEAQISSEENLSAYIDSRTNALNMLLDSVSPDSIIQVAITFRTPIKPEDFLSLYEASLVKFSDYAVIVTDADDSKGIEIFCHQTLGTELTEDMTHIGEGKTVEGIAGVDALMKAKALRMLQSDSRVLLIDPYGDPIANEVAEKYRSMGFSVEGPSPAYVTMWNQYAELWYRVAWFSYQNLWRIENFAFSFVGPRSIIGFSLAFAAGVMTYITADELIPVAHEYWHKHTVSVALLFGIILALMVDIILS